MPNVNTRQRPLIRHCLVCGIAMQASKSRENIAHFDRFECLTCHSVISEAKLPPAGYDDKAN